ncbi:acyltransferase [Nocardioides sp. zg-536]|uniref:Acyltransferase n=1 Tax=Nocardioides faecalis TaxID=2803858 RepID=A0A938Y898_9ACTN|nr:acyltransferase family protein [Nocardioides faecalis]MBM9461039.1 acyltransferase [Nocardioides faecalis]QVI59126.1 acyltransferase [Nocardioides faecalis]
MSGASGPHAAGRKDGLRTDVQALRAIAVTLVLVFHLWPSSITGGYVGVDVFFVISGFLITSHLLGRRPRTGRDLADFWARRIRRLLPASLTVLVATLAATRLLAPETRWGATADQAQAAALYYVNWLLASSSVDYLAADDAPSAVQHFWSLSVEEQFYVGWPILVLVLGLLGTVGALRRHSRAVLGAGLVLVALASFAWSVYYTAADPARAYFVTTTRVWELAAGGILAFGVTGARWRAPRAGSALAVLGLLLIVVAAVRYDEGTAFPGTAAALPVLGAVLVIAGQTAPSSGVGRVLAVRPVQWLGDVSYAVYLWHWPIIVLLGEVSGRLGVLDSIAVLASTLVLAALTKKYVEDPFRGGRWSVRLRDTYVLGASGMAVVVALTLLQGAELDRRQARAQEQLAQATDDPCFGAASLAPGAACEPPTGAPVPAPATAAEDRSEAYEEVGGRDCWASRPDFDDVRCSFGPADADVRVVLTGNSHAGHWLPALQVLAQSRGWRIDTYLASQCALSQVPQRFDTDAHSRACQDWVRRTTATIAQEAPDLVVTSNRISVSAVGVAPQDNGAAYRSGYEAVLREWSEAGLAVLALHDTPAPGDGGLHSVPDCVAEHLDDLEACSAPRSEWEPDDVVVDAVAAIGDPRVRSADLNDLICGPQRCEGVVGGAVVYFDGSHLTATYARTLAPFLAPVVDDLLPEPRAGRAVG